MINEKQRRSVATALGLLDETLCLFEAYANGREVRSVCYEERNRLSARQRRELLRVIGRLRAVMDEMKQTLNLPSTVVDVRQRIWGHAAGFWEVLAELDSKRLRAYGPVSPDLAAYLDPRVQRLLDELMRLSTAVGRGEATGEGGAEIVRRGEPPGRVGGVSFVLPERARMRYSAAHDAGRTEGMGAGA